MKQFFKIGILVLSSQVMAEPKPSQTSDGIGQSFKDCADCPEMVVVPSGSFMMGSKDGEEREKPVHKVTIAYSFAVGKYEVTFAEWDACVADGGCNGHNTYEPYVRNRGYDGYRPDDPYVRNRGYDGYKPDDEGWGRGNRPVMNVSWDDAKSYVQWLSRKTGKNYRLLSESEWEYVARAGTSTKYSWGNDIGVNRANCDGCGSQWDKTAPVGSFAANPWGLYDMSGNVREWVEDCWHDSYKKAPSDGSARTAACTESRPVLRGGSWVDEPFDTRLAVRHRNSAYNLNYYVGFRVARSN